MDIIEVDPKLFVTCRLCLEDLGQFQIVPSVAQQIKFCFDIDVEPFDGLPQLICFKCKEVLNKFHTVKTTFCDKQAQLKIRVLKKEGIPISQHNTVSSNQQNQLNSNDTTAGTITSKPKTKRVIQSSSSDEAEPEQIPKTKAKKRRTLTRNKVMEWEKDYKKEIVCKICSSHWLKKTSYSNHFRSHDALISKFKNVFSKPCTVILEKFDGKPNVTGASNIVVLSSNKIIKFGDMHFHTVYSRDAIVDENVTEKNIAFKPSNETNLSENLNYDDVDDEIVVKRKSRSLRLMSKSSNDTVVLENNDKNESSDNDYDSRTASQCSDEMPVAGNDICISIDDSESDSNSGNFDSGQRVKQPIEAKFGDYKVIQGIISMCVNAYQKKNEGADIDAYINVMRNKKDKTQVSNESQLKHKLLSIGRKIINKQGFNCTGLLRFMEHKNLEILWITKALPFKTNKDTNYIRILTKLRENAMLDDSGWHITSNTELDVSSPDENKLSEAARTSIYECKNSEQDTITSEKKLDKPKNIENDQQNVLNCLLTAVDNSPAVLYLSSNNNASNQPKKILNANPVANPKLLPKKTGQCNERASKPPAANQNVCQIDSEQANFCMPIITSTHSLATGTIEEQKEDHSVPPVVAPNIETPAPRIKVKPASELMSERILNSIRNDKTASPSVDNILSSPNVWQHQQPINVFVPNMSPPPVSENQPLQLVQIPCITLPSPYQEMAPKQTADSQREQIILDTIEFPNTKTESPFKYFKDLLQVHSLVLLHPCDILSRDYHCLIKFKVLFKRETNKDKPVVLCLSLFCQENKFCLKIKDGSQQNIDIDKISAHWQWEILQIYRGEVVKRILENAQRIGHEQHAYAMNFFCLLKSINGKKIE